tara:strand:- start:173 stop:322 length:150 start_codon:yes stop_codon:yes gene_type:complete
MVLREASKCNSCWKRICPKSSPKEASVILANRLCLCFGKSREEFENEYR